MTQIQVVTALLDAEEIEPGCILRHELYPLDHARPLAPRLSARELRRDREEEFIDKPLCDETAEQTGATFVEQ